MCVTKKRWQDAWPRLPYLLPPKLITHDLKLDVDNIFLCPTEAFFVGGAALDGGSEMGAEGPKPFGLMSSWGLCLAW